MVSYVPQLREKQMVRIYPYVHICVDLPVIMGALLMVAVLWQLLECYYRYFYGHTTREDYIEITQTVIMDRLSRHNYSCHL